MAATYTRNIQGRAVKLTLIEVDPREVKLDPTNPRVGFSMRQLPKRDRTDAACELLLTSQEETEALMRSLQQSGGVQEPIYVRHDMRVAEGNRRVVALRAALEAAPDDERFARMPAWLIPKGTPEDVIQDLLNEIHLGGERGWAPYEKALQMRALLRGRLIEDEIAERYRMTASEVKQHLAAADFMDEKYFPITPDSTDPEHRTKYSYFLEFCKSGRLQAHCKTIRDLPDRFARWVRDGRIDTGARVRRLPRILDSGEATRLLDLAGFDAADEYLAKIDPREQELYVLLEQARARLRSMTVAEVIELRDSADRLAILASLKTQVESRLSDVADMASPRSKRERVRTRTRTR